MYKVNAKKTKLREPQPCFRRRLARVAGRHGQRGAVVHEKSRECLSEDPRKSIRFHHCVACWMSVIGLPIYSRMYHFPKPSRSRHHMEGLGICLGQKPGSNWLVRPRCADPSPEILILRTKHGVRVFSMCGKHGEPSQKSISISPTYTGFNFRSSRQPKQIA